MIVNESPQPRQLNPFAFPSETDTRFALFVLAMLVVALSSGFLASISLNPDQANPYERISLPKIEPGQPNFFEEYRAYYLRIIEATITSLVLPVGLTVTIFFLGTILYRRHPARLRRQKHLVSLREELDPLLYREIQSLVRAVSVVPPPTILLGKEIFSQSAQAFGLPRQYVLGIQGGLRLLLRKAPNAFRVIMLHELAHIFNRDIGRVYFAQALWSAAFLLTILPLALIFVLISLYSNVMGLLTGEWNLYRLLAINLPTVVIYILKIGAIILTVATVRADLLRVREIYADVRAGLWGAKDSLQALLQHGCAQEKTVRGLHWWRLHPTPQERLSALLDSAYAFKISRGVTFTVGVMIAVMASEVFTLTLFAVNGISAIGGYVVTFLGDIAIGFAWLIFIGKYLLVTIFVMLVFFGIAYFISNTVGLEVQRESVADIAMNRTGVVGYLRLALPATLMAFGLEVGFLIDPSLFSGLGIIFALDPPTFFSQRGLIPTLLTIPEFVMAAGLCWFWLAYARFFGQRLLGSHTGATPPKWKLRGMALALSVMWWVLFLPVALFHGIIVAIGIRAIPVDQINDQAPMFLVALVVCLIGSLLTFVIFFGASWVLLKFGRLIWSPRCPSCGRITHHEVVIGKMCENCSKELAPWLFTDQ